MGELVFGPLAYPSGHEQSTCAHSHQVASQRTSTADVDQHYQTSMQALEALACLHSHTMQWLTSDHMDSCVQGDTADLQPDGFCSAARRIAPWDCTFIDDQPGEEGVATMLFALARGFLLAWS